MTSLDRVNAPSAAFLDCVPGAVTLIDLAYDEYVARDRDGAATAHVERYFSHLAHAEAEERS